MIFTLSACAKDPVVTFDSNGGSSVNSAVIEKGGVVNAPVAPTKENAIFKCWTLNGEEYDFSSPVTKDMTLVAKWNDTVYVTFRSNGTEEKISVEVGTPVIMKEPAAKEGYVFDYWVIKGTEEKYDFTKLLDSDVELEAKYRQSLIYPESLAFEMSSYDIDAGSIVNVRPVIYPVNANTNTGVTYKSSSPSVATVDANGNVTGIKGGKATITATTENGKTATTVVYVNQIGFIVYSEDSGIYETDVFKEMNNGDTIYIGSGDFYTAFKFYQTSYVKGELVKTQIDRYNGVEMEYAENNAFEMYCEWQGGGDAGVIQSVLCGPSTDVDSWVAKHENDNFDFIVTFTYKGISKSITVHYQSKYM